MKKWVIELKTYYEDMPEQQDRTFFEQRKCVKLVKLIKDLDAFIWYSTNEGNLRGLLDRLSYDDSAKDIYKCYMAYNRRLQQAKLPSVYSGVLIPGLNAANNYVTPVDGTNEYESDFVTTSDEE
jgi:hypothetical protein